MLLIRPGLSTSRVEGKNSVKWTGRVEGGVYSEILGGLVFRSRVSLDPNQGFKCSNAYLLELRQALLTAGSRYAQVLEGVARSLATQGS